jgi:hypothetical protein
LNVLYFAFVQRNLIENKVVRVEHLNQADFDHILAWIKLLFSWQKTCAAFSHFY